MYMYNLYVEYVKRISPPLEPHILYEVCIIICFCHMLSHIPLINVSHIIKGGHKIVNSLTVTFNS